MCVCERVCNSKKSCIRCSSVHSEVTDFVIKTVTGVHFLSHRWRIQFGGEPRETRREMKCERATRALSNGLMAGVCYVKLAVGVIAL